MHPEGTATSGLGREVVNCHQVLPESSAILADERVAALLRCIQLGSAPLDLKICLAHLRSVGAFVHIVSWLFFVGASARVFRL